MPEIFSFSLDARYDGDIIKRIYKMKNRSAWIRQMLRRELDYERLQILVDVLYAAYKTQVEIQGLRDPNSLYQFREKADRVWATRIDQSDLSHVHQGSHNSSQEQE